MKHIPICLSLTLLAVALQAGVAAVTLVMVGWTWETVLMFIAALAFGFSAKVLWGSYCDMKVLGQRNHALVTQGVPVEEKAMLAEEEDRLGYRVAWRNWTFRVVDGELRLVSGVGKTVFVWEPNKAIEAFCDGKAIDPIQCPIHRYSGAGCGINALYDDWRDEVPGDWSAYGTVRLWGSTILGSKGCRSQYAYPDRIVGAWPGAYYGTVVSRILGPPPTRLDLVAELNRLYGLDKT